MKPTVSKTEMLPCPFCGGEAMRMEMLDSIRIQTLKATRYFGCKNCDTVFSFGSVTGKEAINAWNRRA